MRNFDIERADTIGELNKIIRHYLESETIMLYKLEIKREPVSPYYSARIDWEDNER